MRHPLQKGHLEGKVEMRQGPLRPHQNATTQKLATRRDVHTFSGQLPSRLGSARGGQKTCAPLCRIAQDRQGSQRLQGETPRSAKAPRRNAENHREPRIENRREPRTAENRRETRRLSRAPQNYLRHERPPKGAGLWEFWGRVGGGLRRVSQAFGSLHYSRALKPQGAPEHSPHGTLFEQGATTRPHRRL